MKDVLSLFLCIHLLTFNTLALASDCVESVTLIEKGTPASCTGFLFSPDAEQQASLDHRNAKYYKLLSEKLELRSTLIINQNEILEKRLQLYMEQSNTLSQELQKKERMSDWQKVGYFVLGITLTSLAVYGASQLK